jgi:hypothetical protein
MAVRILQYDCHRLVDAMMTSMAKATDIVEVVFIHKEALRWGADV